MQPHETTSGLRRFFEVFGAVVFFFGLAHVPEQIRLWLQGIGIFAQWMDHKPVQLCFVLVGLSVFLLAQRWPKGGSNRNRTEPNVSRLEIQYDLNKHYTKYGNGSVQVRITIKNAGTERVQLNAVKVVGLVPRLNIGEVSALSTQYHSMPLKLVRRKIGDFIDAEDSVEALVVHSAKGDSEFLFDSDEVTGPYRVFTTSQYEVEILATGVGCQPDRKFFLLKQVDGILRFDRCEPVVSYPPAATATPQPTREPF